MKLLPWLALVGLVGTSMALAWPRPRQWATENCGSYCVHAHCPRGFEADLPYHHNLDGNQWSIDAFNDAQQGKCRVTRASLSYAVHHWNEDSYAGHKP